MSKLSNRHKTVLNWSGGKDSVITLQRLLKNEQISVERLLVSVHESTKRVSMHGVRRELIEKQAELLKIPVTFLSLPLNPSMNEYNSRMEEQMVRLMDEGFTHSAYGDIFLEDLRSYREKQLARIGMKSLFPVWGEETAQLAHSFIDDGFKAVLVCVDTQLSISEYAGKKFSKGFLNEIQDDIDPCGENGEFHTFVFDGPLFPKPVQIRKGKITDKEYPSPEGKNKIVFRFCDLIPD